MSEDTPRVKQLITYYETAAAEDRESAKALRERRKAERAEKRRSRQLAKLQQQETRSPKSKKFKVSSPAVRKQKAIVLQEAPEELKAPLLEAFVELAPLPEPLFEPSPQEISQLEEIPIENKVEVPEIEAPAAPQEEPVVVVETEEEEVVVEVDLQVTVTVHPVHSEPVETEKQIEVIENEIFEEPEVESKVEEAPEAPQEVHEPVALVPATPRNDTRTFVAREILTTERTYVDGLRTCISNYMTPLTSKVDDKDLAQIFGNLPNILRLNETLLGQLECRLAEWSDTTVLGDIFIELAPFLSMYADYCVNYETAAQLVAKYKQTTSVFKELQEKNLSVCGGLDILDYLIMPVQRVPRYRLLLDQLLKHTPEEHADHASLKQASCIVSDKATEINHKMALVNQQKKLMELSTRFETVPLSEGLVQPYRHFVSEFIIEWIPSFDSTESKNVYLFLLNDLMLLAPVPKQADDKLVCLGAYPLWSVFLKKLDDSWALSKRENPPFQLVHSSATYNLLISCAETKQKFKVEMEAQREKLLTSHPQLKTKRLAIKLEMNHPKQEWTAVEPAPLFASRISQQSLAKEAAEFTQRALEELLRENKQALESMPATPAGKTPKKSRLFQLKETVVAAFSPLKTPGKRRDSLGGGAGLFGHSPSSSRFATMRGSTSYTTSSSGNDAGGALFATVAEALTSDTATTAASAPVLSSVEGISQADLVRQQIEELNKKAAELTRKEQKKQERKRKREEAEAEAAATAAAAAAEEAAKQHKKKDKKHKREQSAVVAPTIEPEEPKEAKKSKKHKREQSENLVNEATTLDPAMQPSEKKRRKKQDNLAVLPPPEPLMLPTMIFAQIAEVEKPEQMQVEEKLPEKKHRSKKHRHEAPEVDTEPALAVVEIAEAPVVEEKKHRGKKSSKAEPVAEILVEKSHKKLKSSTSEEDLKSSSHKKHKSSSKRDLVAESKENAGENKSITSSSKKRKAEAISPAPASDEAQAKKSSKRKLVESTPSKSHKSHKVASN